MEHNPSPAAAAPAQDTSEIGFVSQPGIETEKVSQTVGEKNDRDVEIASLGEEEKGYYSKLSVWLMVLFSGLAIGSDG